MKVWLDDIREEPQGWVRTWWPNEVINLLKSKKVTELSLDHDLGNDEHGTGYDVILWIEKETILNGFSPPKNINVHSANSSACEKMERGIESIRQHDNNYSNLKRLYIWNMKEFYHVATTEGKTYEECRNLAHIYGLDSLDNYGWTKDLKLIILEENLKAPILK